VKDISYSKGPWRVEPLHLVVIWWFFNHTFNTRELVQKMKYYLFLTSRNKFIMGWPTDVWNQLKSSSLDRHLLWLKYQESCIPLPLTIKRLEHSSLTSTSLYNALFCSWRLHWYDFCKFKICFKNLGQCISMYWVC
jgi:hypothetical protein